MAVRTGDGPLPPSEITRKKGRSLAANVVSIGYLVNFYDLQRFFMVMMEEKCGRLSC